MAELKWGKKGNIRRGGGLRSIGLGRIFSYGNSYTCYYVSDGEL